MTVRSDILWGPERVFAGESPKLLANPPLGQTWLVKEVYVQGGSVLDADWRIEIGRAGTDETVWLLKGVDSEEEAAIRAQVWWVLDPQSVLYLTVVQFAGSVVTVGFGARLAGVAPT